jgi:hypothetical protein
MFKPKKAGKNYWNALKFNEGVPYNTHYWNESGDMVKDKLEGDDNSPYSTSSGISPLGSIPGPGAVSSTPSVSFLIPTAIGGITPSGFNRSGGCSVSSTPRAMCAFEKTIGTMQKQ